MAKKAARKASPGTIDVPSETGSHGVTPFRDVDRLFDSLFDRGWMSPMRWEHPFWERFGALEKHAPRVDVINRDGEVVVRAELPGFEREELDVSVTDSSVTIKGERHEESQQEEGEYFRSEISHGAFSRTVTLPCEIDADKAGASFRNGVLELTLPKLKQANRRKLEVK
ncbi:Hsp20/alpha crystallin family protein [Halomonas sp. C05BenzN]|uniref:Hsp20/alpha crystallin family protein n=1 Tax=Halomonas sp. C05BenzN TaxID=3411041 RepID=UPI003B96054A